MPFLTEAVVMREIGAPEVLELREVDLPWPGNDDEVSRPRSSKRFESIESTWLT